MFSFSFLICQNEVEDSRAKWAKFKGSYGFKYIENSKKKIPDW